MQCIDDDPNVAPTPTMINRKMGATGVANTLNGRDNKIRKRLMHEFGFEKDPETGRWNLA